MVLRSMPRLHQRGFTLMEVMIAITLLAVVSMLSWRGLDSMLRTQERVAHNSESLAVLQTGMAQWIADLNAIAEVRYLTPIDWDGKVLRITRMAPRALESEPAAMQVVAWSERVIDGQKRWLRWQSVPVRSRLEWDSAWQDARLWVETAGSSLVAREVVLLPMLDWEIFYSRDGHWVNPQSSNAQGEAVANTTLPDAVRLRLQIAAGYTVSGWVSRDWVNPQQGKARL